MIRGQVLRLEAGAHGAVEYEHPLLEGVKVPAVGESLGHLTEILNQ
jgi:hypothetical protein